MTVIDTPGFGDTIGLPCTLARVDKIKDFILNSHRHSIEHINAIGFVTPASLARLTQSQKSVFDSVVSIFGKDMKQNTILLVNFCDAQIPPVLNALEAVGIPRMLMFQFNNSALFTKKTVIRISPERDTRSSTDETHADPQAIQNFFWDIAVQSIYGHVL